MLWDGSVLSIMWSHKNDSSAKRSIQYLLDKWHLKCKSIPSSFAGAWSIVEDHQAQDEVSVSAGSLSSVFLLEISLL